MGMAASQARFLSLTARKTNVEFEGQQINQQRTSLSNESSNYYNRLCNMVVPTPPSSEDFSKTTYTFTDGAEKNTINSLIAQPNGWYILNYTQSYETESVVSNGTSIVNRQQTETGESYYIGATRLRKMNEKDIETLTVDSEEVKQDSYLRTLEPSQLKDLLMLEQQYMGMLSTKYQDENWYVRYQLNSGSNTYEPVFYSETQLMSADYSEKTGASLTGVKSYVYGNTTETREIKNAKARVEQDSSGRYMSIVIYETNADGSVKINPSTGKEMYTEYQLTATTMNDDRAYNDAMNQYAYNKALYDQEINSINSKIEIVQAQDKDLELRLKQLDTEQNAISQELEAVKKVITKNVELSFKTFNA